MRASSSSGGELSMNSFKLLIASYLTLPASVVLSLLSLQCHALEIS